MVHPLMNISVAMATYNGGRFIQEQLDSLLAQNRLPFELVITDDGSTDGTLKIIEEFAASAPFPVRLHLNPTTLGPGHNFARAIELSTGELVFLCDQDDVWDADKVERMADEMEANLDIACLLCDARLADGHLNTDGRTKRRVMRTEGLADLHFVQGCCAVLRRPLVDLALPMPDDERSHDNWVVGLSDALNLTRRSDDVLQYYRLHGSNVSDFFVNRPRPETVSERLLRKLNGLTRRLTQGGGLEPEHARLARILTRLQTRPEAVRALAGERRAATTLAALAHREEGLAARIAVRAAPRFRRVGLLLAHLRGGTYRSGPITALKDLLGPRTGRVQNST